MSICLGTTVSKSDLAPPKLTLTPSQHPQTPPMLSFMPSWAHVSTSLGAGAGGGYKLSCCYKLLYPVVLVSLSSATPSLFPPLFHYHGSTALNCSSLGWDACRQAEDAQVSSWVWDEVYYTDLYSTHTRAIGEINTTGKQGIS